MAWVASLLALPLVFLMEHIQFLNIYMHYLAFSDMVVRLGPQYVLAQPLSLLVPKLEALRHMLSKISPNSTSPEP